MKNITTITLSLVALAMFAFTTHSGGVYKTNSGNISFFSHTPVEDIQAENHTVKSAFSSANGRLQFSVVIKDFEFKKALMQEHFNENYLESDQYPKATFNGMIQNMAEVKVNENGTYTSPVNGKLTIKDVTKDVKTTATFTVTEGVVNAKADFNINPSDYNIEIPKATIGKISDNIKVSIDADYTHKH